ncbi:acetyltransferase [Cryobacterium sp. TMT2-18-3]|uniref:Acetyltransferase n=1 Tax=Cryobacterium sandaracinum TaxID=1259247 RepID=A0ABY2JHL0_9MICO|nr:MULTISPECIES: DapH/DapD/GlmU-related protein [Cryobacterium]TFC32018.1 acetyltransferase [Cryobacterium sp. TMT2-18-2]TFC62930.1 acetyltransferase [Cryobacterium sp. TMT2-18-3]TFD06088.1 acetyltransferase [Cryobacterium sandaracinum]
MVRRIIEAALRSFAVRKNVKFGFGFHVGPGSVLWAPRSLTIGKDVYVGKNVTIEVDGEIGDGVLIANLVGIVGRTDHDLREIGTSIRRSLWVGNDPERLSQATTIGSDVWIGYGAVVLSGISVGDSSVIGAGSIITQDIPSNSIAVGSPARVLGPRFTDEELDEHWKKLRKSGHRILIGKPVSEA